MRYLILGHFLSENYFTDEITKRDLLDLKEHSTDYIVDLINKTYFDTKENKWIPIEEK